MEKVEYTLGALLSVVGLLGGVSLESILRFNNFEYPIYCSPAAVFPVIGSSVGSLLDYKDAMISRNYISKKC